MKIGILTSVHAPTDTRVYFKQARSLARAGHEVVLIAREGSAIDDIEHVKLPVPRSRWQRIMTCFQVVQKAVSMHCDMYHIHDPELLPFGLVIKQMTRAPIVFDVHENVRAQIHNKYWIPAGMRRLVARLYGFIEATCLRYVDHVVLAEDSYTAEYERFSPVVIRNYPILPAEVYATHSRSYSGRPMLVYCGVVAEVRGGLEMLRAAAIVKETCPDVELHVIGPFSPEDFESRMKREVSELGLTDHVRFYGRVPLDHALQTVRECDIGFAVLHPDSNYVESLPTKMFEYMSLRLPVIVSDFPFWRGIVESADCGVAVNPQDPREIAKAILDVQQSAENLTRLGENGHRAVLERYTWAAEERKLFEIYPPCQTDATIDAIPKQPEQMRSSTVAVPVSGSGLEFEERE